MLLMRGDESNKAALEYLNERRWRKFARMANLLLVLVTLAVLTVTLYRSIFISAKVERALRSLSEQCRGRNNEVLF